MNIDLTDIGVDHEIFTSPMLFLKVLLDYYPGGLCGYDKDGSPVAVELFGYLDMKGLMLSTKRSDLERLKLFQCEKLEELLESRSTEVDMP